MITESSGARQARPRLFSLSPPCSVGSMDRMAGGALFLTSRITTYSLSISKHGTFAMRTRLGGASSSESVPHSQRSWSTRSRSRPPGRHDIGGFAGRETPDSRRLTSPRHPPGERPWPSGARRVSGGGSRFCAGGDRERSTMPRVERRSGQTLDVWPGRFGFGLVEVVP